MQVLPAVTVVVVCVALVLAAVHETSTWAADRSARQRAAAQADVLLDALRTDPALADCCGVVSWAKALNVSAGDGKLSFLPATARTISLSWMPNGTEVFLFGNSSALGRELELRAQPVPVRLADETVHPGILRVGVEVR